MLLAYCDKVVTSVYADRRVCSKGAPIDKDSKLIAWHGMFKAVESKIPMIDRIPLTVALMQFVWRS